MRLELRVKLEMGVKLELRVKFCSFQGENG